MNAVHWVSSASETEAAVERSASVCDAAATSQLPWSSRLLPFSGLLVAPLELSALHATASPWPLEAW